MWHGLSHRTTKGVFSFKRTMKSSRFLFLAVFALFALLVATGLHGLSIGCWDDSSLMPPEPEGYRYRELGKPRWERADDWNVSVPQIMAQCASPDFFPCVNPRVDLGRDMFASTPCNPVWDVTAPAQPHNWGFFLFGAERGFAWSWWLRFLGLPLAAFLALRPRLGGDSVLAASGAIAFTLGAPTQWWDTSLPYLLLYGFASLVFLDIIQTARRQAARWTAALGLACVLPAFFLAGYPPFAALLLPVFLMLALPGAARTDSPRPYGAPPSRRGASRWGRFAPPSSVGAGQGKRFAPPSSVGAGQGKRFALVFGLVVAAALFVAALVLHAETIRHIASSAYPGARSFAGGTPSRFLRHIGLGLLAPAFPFDALRPAFAPFASSNPCNAARWYAPALALSAALCLRAPDRPSLCDRLLPAYAAILALWALLPWPAWLARVTGLSKIDPRRAGVILGFVLLLCCLRLLARRRVAGIAPPRRLPLAVAALAAVLALAAIFLPGGIAAFPSRRAAAVIGLGAAAVAAVASWSLLAARRIPFCAALVALALPGLAVHPLAQGLAPMRDKPFADLARSIENAEPGRWLANTSTTGNFLLAQGLDCIAGTQAYAVPAMWTILDPDGAGRAAWHRYAHTIVELGPDGAPLAAKAAKTDLLRYTLTESRLRALGVRHLVWSGKKLHEPWLRYDGRVRLHFFYTVLPHDGPRDNPPRVTRGASDRSKDQAPDSE